MHVLNEQLDTSIGSFTVMIKEQRILGAESFTVNFYSTVPTSLDGVKVSWFINLAVFRDPLWMVSHGLEWHHDLSASRSISEYLHQHFNN
jgi:hypothetical protein